MAKKELFNVLSTPTKSLDVVARTADANGASVDLKDYHGCHIIVDVDAFTDGSVAISVEESSDNSTFTAVAAADLEFDVINGLAATGIITIDGAADDDQAYHMAYIGSKRYIRLVVDETGTTSGAIAGGMLIPHSKRNKGKLIV
jgi:hypothetical protein